MRMAALIAAALALLGAAGCDSIDRLAGSPSPTSVPMHLPPFEGPGRPVAVCYNKGAATPEALAAAALAQCAEPGSTVEYLTADLHLNECPLLKKRRAVYLCREPQIAPPQPSPR